MDALGSVMQGFQFGQGLREVKTKRKLADLYSQAYTAPREKRGGLIGQMIGLDPEAGMRAHDMGNKMDDRTMQEVVRAAKTLAVLPPEQQGAYYQQELPKFRAMGLPLPDQMDDSVRESVAKIAQAWGDVSGQGGVFSQKVGEDGFIYNAMRDGRMVNTGVRADRQMWFRDHPGMAPELVGKDGVVRPVGTAPQGAMIGGDGTPVFIDPSIPPEVRAQILQGEQIAQAPTQRAWTQNTPDMVRGAAPRPSEAQVAAERAAAEARVRAAYEPGIAAATEGAKTNARIGTELGYAPRVAEAEANRTAAVEAAKSRVASAAEARGAIPDLQEELRTLQRVRQGFREGRYSTGWENQFIPDQIQSENNQVLATDVNRMILDLAAKMKGTLSDKDVAFLRSASVDLNKREGANAQILDQVIARVQRGLQQAQQKAGVQAPAQAPKRRRFNPATGRIE